MASILVVDDEPRMLDLVQMVLGDSYIVDTASSADEAQEKLQQHMYELCLLDIMMPGMDGTELLQQWRKQGEHIPVIFLTAKSQTEDIVEGLHLGADDYVTKPFEPKELLARVESVLRRTTQQGMDHILQASGLKMDLDVREVTYNGCVLKLTPLEYDLLQLLLKRPGHAFSRDYLLQAVWGYDFVGDLRTVDTHVKNLREKINHAGGSRELIETVWGVGYRLRRRSDT